MILSHFLSRQKHDDNDPHGILHVSFNMHKNISQKILQLRKDEQIFSTNSTTDKIKWNKTTRGTWNKENVRYK